MANKRPKIHILFKFVEGPWGGGNQFLKALREYFRKVGVYSESPDDAEVILFNSYPFGSEYLFDLAFKLKRKGKILIHRVGPVFRLTRGDKVLDEIILQFNNLFADGTVFQSNWSREKNYEIGAVKSPYETIITNAPNPTIFSPEGEEPFDAEKIKLVATSWSGNIRKGFDIYQYLDEHLDFNRYEMTFVGNSPIEFKNIRWRKPVPSRELANILREHDIYMAASSNDACSNSLIEALHCGLPAVARNDGGHPEITGKAGALFENEAGVIDAIEKVAQNYKHYQALIDLPTLDEVGQKYCEFAQGIYEDYLSGNYRPKPVNLFSNMRVGIKIMERKALNKLQGMIRRG